MKYDPEKHHRRSIRLKGYDYSTSGAYFVTICTHGRIQLFGDISDGELQSNTAGQMVETWWLKINQKYKNVTTDTFVVMPNHFHGIVVIDNESLLSPVGAILRDRPESESNDSAPTLGKIIKWFKTMTTNEYIRNVSESGWMPFEGRFWQRNYYEHIVRSEDELYQMRHYIQYNPLKWENDTNHPDNEWAGKDDSLDWNKM